MATGSKAFTDGQPDSLYQTPQRVFIVIVNYKTADLTIACLRSLEREVKANFWVRVTVVDNDSGDGDAIAASIRENGWDFWASVIVAEHNGGFSYGNNRGIEAGKSLQQTPDYFLLLNPDTEVRPGAIAALVDYLDTHPDVGIAGGSFETQDGVEWPYAFRFPTIPSQFDKGARFAPISWLLRKWATAKTMGKEPAQVDWVSGASMMVRRKLIEDIGLLDDGYFLYFEEVDFCLRARRAGWLCSYVPQSRVMHIFGQSTGFSSGAKALKRMPSYWFSSRTRYFVKNHGLTYARIADLAYGLGLILWSLRRLIRKKKDSNPPGMLADFWRSSILFRSRRHVQRLLEGQPSE